MRMLLLSALIAGCPAMPTGAESPDPTPEATPDPLADGLQFGLPFADPSRISTVVGVDHDPEVHDDVLGSAICRNFRGDPFPSCYDEHDGTDFILDGGFPAMDAGSVDVVAAAAGLVTDLREDQYDRCHAEDFEVSCDGRPIVANFVSLLHDDGRTTLYYHLKTDSVTVEIGDRVACGQVLALVGSSGRSSMPHLHFEVHEIDGSSVDPYREDIDASLWIEQDGDFSFPSLGCDG